MEYDQFGLPAGRAAFNQQETARVFGVHRKTIKKWWDNGLLEYVDHATKRWTPRWAIIAAITRQKSA